MQRDLQSSRVRWLLIIMALAVIVISGTAFAQKDDFAIQDFIPEKFQDKVLHANSNLSLSGNDYNSDYLIYPGSSMEAATNNGNDDTQEALLGGNFNYQYFTVPRYLTTSILLNGNYHNSTSDRQSYRQYLSGGNDNSITKTDSYNYHLYFLSSSDAGWYFFDNLFISSMPVFSISYTDTPKSNNESEQTRLDHTPADSIEINHTKRVEKSDANSKSYHIDMNLLPGWGHVYEGKFASTAMYIINELADNGLIANRPSPSQMIHLTEILYQAKQEHYFDSRLHDIEVLNKILDYLESEKIIDGDKSGSTLIVNDVWKYFPQYDRKFGLQFRAGAGLEYRHNESTTKINNFRYELTTRYHQDNALVIDTLEESSSTHRWNNDDSQNSIYPYAAIRADYHRPIDLKWQFNTSIEGNYFIDSYRETSSTTDYLEPSASHDGTKTRYDYSNYYRFELDGTVHYIPDSRTYAFFSASLEYGHLDKELTRTDIDETTEISESTTGKTISNWHYSLGAGLTYRISVPVTLTFSAIYRSNPDISFAIGGYNDYNGDSYDVSAALSYYIM